MIQRHYVLTTAKFELKPVLQMVAIAQLVERRLVVPDVAGSSPVGHPF